MYAQDYQQQLPRSTHSALAHRAMPWGYALSPYLDNGIYTGDGPQWQKLFNGLYRCPDDPREEVWSYGKNAWFELTPGESGEIEGTASGPVYPRTLDVPRPAATILYGELASGSMADHIMAHFWYLGASPEVDMYRHGDTSNYIFVDGHVESRAFETTFKLPTLDAWRPGTAQ
ncbi:hypothetical protein HED60_13345 [Planctomycetales bacterium ZRK34]|nr:hypothetical protein HED60_13345 [Planctomycetales bacterium ZRK34]